MHSTETTSNCQQMLKTSRFNLWVCGHIIMTYCIYDEIYYWTLIPTTTLMMMMLLKLLPRCSWCWHHHYKNIDKITCTLPIKTMIWLQMPARMKSASYAKDQLMAFLHLHWSVGRSTCLSVCMCMALTLKFSIAQFSSQFCCLKWCDYWKNSLLMHGTCWCVLPNSCTKIWKTAYQ